VNISDLSDAIQLALAPVFLLTGIAGLLNVMTSRLARIIDRGRQLSDRSPFPADTVAEDADRELQILDRRRHFTSAAITACTFAALLVCVVIAALFFDVMLDAPLQWLVALSFTGATLALIVGLGFFLREVHLATKTVRIVQSARSRSGS
jgi:hypothetical protein